MKNKIKAMSLADKITLLLRIRKDYPSHRHFWTSEKVEWLERVIMIEINTLSKFEI